VPTHKQHGDYLRDVRDESESRRIYIEDLFRTLFPDLLEESKTIIVRLGDINIDRLAETLLSHPDILKPLLAVCNMGKRAIAQDLGIELDTYRPRLDSDLARTIAGYIYPLLPPKLSLDVIARLDRYQWIDSAVRKTKGRWEKKVVFHLEAAGLNGKKRKFRSGEEEFELDYSVPPVGDIRVGVDVKHIGHSSDKQKRGDEIVNKAAHLKLAYPDSLFFSIVKYPYPDDVDALISRLTSGESRVDKVCLAGDDESSLRQAAKDLIDIIRQRMPDLLKTA